MIEEFETLSNLEIVATRYPQLTFLINLLSKNKEKDSTVMSSSNAEEFAVKVMQKNPRLILLIGVDKGECLIALQDWLANGRVVDILIFEEDLDQLSLFIRSGDIRPFLVDARIHLRYVMGHAELKEALIEGVKEYPAEHIVLHLLSSYNERYNEAELSLEVFRKATLSSSHFHEQAYYHLLFHNLIKNFSLLHECFYADALKGQFKDIPAIICGAGPSLSDHISLLKKLENKALIIGGGSTITALTTQGVLPHIGFALDPNPEEYDRLKGCLDFEIPILFGSRLQPDAFKALKGPKGYMRTRSGGFVEQALEEKLDLQLDPLLQGLSEEGLSVTVMCLAAAVHFGCNPIFLCGIDLAYVGGKRYADGVMLDSRIDIEKLLKEAGVAEQIVAEKNREGENIYTTVKWIMEAATIERFALEHPENKIFDSIQKGLGFKSLEKISLDKAAQKYLKKDYNLKNYVERCIQNCPHFREKEEEIVAFIQELKISLEKSEKIIAHILQRLKQLQEKKEILRDPQEDTIFTLYQMDLEEEVAYLWLLKPLEAQLSYLLRKESFNEEDQEKTYLHELNFLEKQWNHFALLIDSYLKKF